jgi:quinol monooxygenase YgiN
MATILAHIRVRPGTAARFEQVARALHDATHQHEPGVRRYEYWRGAGEDTYYALLAFDDYTAFVTHQASDHHEAASHELADLIESIRLEWVDPVPGASPLPRTVDTDLPAGASDLERRQARRFPAGVASWWPEEATR